MTTLNKTNFFQKVQQILEQYYLKPLDGSVKNNLKDGFIERPIHGATHASRAALWVLAMHNFLQKISPNFVNKSMTKIASQLNIETEELLLIILMTMVCHDAARKGEGTDLWEEESAQITYNVLLGLGLDDSSAKLFSLAIQFKDKPEEYKIHLAKLGIDPKDLNAFGYIRTIINLGDNLDVMRCVGDFQAKYIFDTLENIEGFDETSHEHALMELLKEIHQIIYEQGDMLFACNIIDLKETACITHKAHVSNKEKVSYEHAENVMAVLFEDISKNPKLQPLLTGLNVPKAQKYTSDPKFDPFIHGSNSSIFSILPKSNFEMMSPIEMMRTYQAAPMTGELTQGGYRTIEAKGLGNTSFAKISAQGTNSYTLKKVIDNYTNLNVGLTNKNIVDFKAACNSGFLKSYLNINLILIYFVRARQSYQSLEQVISPEELNLLLTRMEASYQFYYFIQLLGTHIFPNVSELNKFRIISDANQKYPDFTEQADQISMAVENFLTYEHIVQKIIDNNIDIKSVFDKPTKEGLDKVLNILEVPKKCTLTNLYGEVAFKDVELPLTQFFSLTPDAFEYGDNYKNRDALWTIQNNRQGDPDTINRLLKKFIEGDAKNKFFFSLGSDAKSQANAFYERVQLFKKLVNTPQTQFKITDIQEYFLERKFPIILVSDAEEKISLFNFGTEEYRSNSNLKFGTDIKIIATDNNFHRLEILKYLEIHKINNIQVILFNDLETMKATQNKLSSPQHHSDSMPTLKWMAAKQVPQSIAQSIKENSFLLLEKSTLSPKLYSKQNVSEASALLDDAKTYREIQFEPCCSFRCASQSHHAAIDLLVKAGIEANEFQSLIGYSARHDIVLPQLISYLAKLNLPQFYRKTLEDKEFRSVLTLFFRANITEGITEDLLSDSRVVGLIHERLYSMSFNSDYFNAMIILYNYQKHLLNSETNKQMLSNDSLLKLIIYFDKNKLQKYYELLFKHSSSAYSLLMEVERSGLSNEVIGSIFDDENIIQAVSKHYISFHDLEELKAGFILSKLGIEINCSIDYELRKVVHTLSNHGFTDKLDYLKVIKSKELRNALYHHEIKSLFQINAIFKANEFGILAQEEVKIKQHPQLAKMLTFANTQSEWILYSEFYDLLGQFDMQQYALRSTNQSAYNTTIALIKDINNLVDQCFSFANDNPNKMNSFSIKCNGLIETARAILELNTGFIGAIDTSLSYISYLNPIPYFYSDTNAEKKNVSYSFFKNDSAKLIETMKCTLGKMERDVFNCN